MSNKRYIPGLIPWIALLFLLLYMVNTMERMVDHLSLMEIRILEIEIEAMDYYEEEEEWFKDWDDMDDEDKQNHLRISLTTT